MNAEPTSGTDRRIYGYYYYYYILNICLYFNYLNYYFEIPVNEFYKLFVKRQLLPLLLLLLVESKTWTHHGRVRSGRRMAGQWGSAGLDRTGRR